MLRMVDFGQLSLEYIRFLAAEYEVRVEDFTLALDCMGRLKSTAHLPLPL